MGLGNPGTRYASTRHNIGFMAAESILRRYDFPPTKNKYHGHYAEGRIAGQKIGLLLPQTFMNDSGKAVLAALTDLGLKPAEILVIYDELDLSCGKIRLKQAGGAAGHNGIRSIDSHIGANYWRLRLGIGHPGDKAQVHSYVLQPFAADDKPWLEKLLPALAEHAPLLWQANGGASFMSKVALTVTPAVTPAVTPVATSEKIESKVTPKITSS